MKLWLKEVKDLSTSPTADGMGTGGECKTIPRTPTSSSTSWVFSCGHTRPERQLASKRLALESKMTSKMKFREVSCYEHMLRLVHKSNHGGGDLQVTCDVSSMTPVHISLVKVLEGKRGGTRGNRTLACTCAAGIFPTPTLKIPFLLLPIHEKKYLHRGSVVGRAKASTFSDFPWFNMDRNAVLLYGKMIRCNYSNCLYEKWLGWGWESFGNKNTRYNTN